MNRTGARSLGYVAGLTTLLVAGWVLTGQAAKRVKHAEPLPTDWSHRHVVFSHPSTPEEYARVANEPRYWQQVHRRERHSDRDHDEDFERRARSAFKARLHRDWAVNLGTGASVGPGNYPAKFGLDTTKASCSDYAVFGTSLPSPGPTIVGFTNLYSGCALSPTVNWAYDTGGMILTSPITSIDGKQVAVVQSSGGVGQLVLLKWAALSGTIASPIAPAALAPAAYQACTPTPLVPCMTTIGLVDNTSTPVDDTSSSLFYDYGNDIVWVGGAGGWVHKITGVFNGTPAEVTTGGFPAQVSASSTFTSSAVYDSVSQNVYVGDNQGFLYAVNSTNGAVTASGRLDFANGIMDAPIIDQTAGFLYVFVSNDSGITGCPLGAGCAAVYQLSTTFTAGALGTKTQLGDGDSGGAPNPVWIGGFDSAYFSSASGSRTGNLYVCGNSGAVPTLYQVPIAGGVLPASGTPFIPLSTAAPTGCSSVTDIANPNTTGGASERVFVSVQGSGIPLPCTTAPAVTGGCLTSFVVAPWAPSTAYAVGQQVLSSGLHVETVVTATGPSGLTTPAWSGTPAGTTTDGGVTWVDQGVLSANTFPGWPGTTCNAATPDMILDSNGNVEVCTTSGTSGGSTPAWMTAPGAATNDGTAVWTNAGAVGAFSLVAEGGTSGIIEDNVVSQATQAGASQIYFSTLTDQNCGATGTGGCAVQASQPALQ